MSKQRNEIETYTRSTGFDRYVIYDSNGRQEYICECYPGAATSAESWRIYKISRDSNGRLEKLRWASGNDNFDKIAESIYDALCEVEYKYNNDSIYITVSMGISINDYNSAELLRDANYALDHAKSTKK